MLDSARDLLELARRLSGATDVAGLLREAQRAVEQRLGLRHCWLAFAEGERLDRFRMMVADGPLSETVAAHAPVLLIEGDAMLEELVQQQLPLVVYDARSDPRTDKQMVATFDNRSIVNLPLWLVDKPLGMLGTGTFGDEGCRAFSEEEVDFLMQLASHMSVAAGRIRLQEEREARTRERQELSRRLQQAQRLESMGMLAAGVAHDFNNLLTVMMGSAALCQREPISEVQREQLGVLQNAGQRAAELVKQLLTVGQQSVPQLASLDVRRQLERLLALVERMLPPAITVQLVISGELPRVRADGSQLDQVLLNLCLNARDAMPDGGLLVVTASCVQLGEAELALDPHTRPGRYLRITVEDSGVGMAREVSERIFEPFFTTKAADKGTGLGLAVAYGIVRSHGGLLSCESEPARGTTFSIHLPVESGA